MKLTWSKYK